MVSIVLSYQWQKLMLSKKSPDRTFQKKNKIGGENVRTCLHKKCVRIFEHNFVADKAKIRRRAVARQGFLTQSAAKFAEKTCAYACEDRSLYSESTQMMTVFSKIQYCGFKLQFVF